MIPHFVTAPFFCYTNSVEIYFRKRFKPRSSQRSHEVLQGFYRKSLEDFNIEVAKTSPALGVLCVTFENFVLKMFKAKILRWCLGWRKDLNHEGRKEVTKLAKGFALKNV